MTPLEDAYLLARVAICVRNVIAAEKMGGANDGKIAFWRVDDEGNLLEDIFETSRDDDDGLPILDDATRAKLAGLLNEPRR